MKKILFASVALAALASASVASAADLPRRNMTPSAPAYTSVPTFTWTGFYAGVNAGYGWGTFTSGGKGLFGDAKGGMIGGTAGYNYQIGQLVLGVEGDTDWSSAKNTIGVNTGKITNLSTLRGRVGFAADRALVYATGGYAGGQLKTNSDIASSTTWNNGWALGGGIEYAFLNNVSAKAEYLWTDLSSKSILANTSATGLHDSVLRAGVNYHF